MGIGFHQLVLKWLGCLIRFHDKGLGCYPAFVVGMERDHFERVGTTFFFRDFEHEFPGCAVERGNLFLVEEQVGGVYFIVLVVRVYNFEFLVKPTGVEFHGIHELHAFTYLGPVVLRLWALSTVIWFWFPLLFFSP